jgi:starvation-inducible DNA-binding protein
MSTTTRTEAIAEELQPLLAELVNLHLDAKQLHWNVKGRNFLPLHEQLDALTATAHAAADEVAERLAALQISPDGRASTVAAGANAGPLPTGFIAEATVLDLVVSRLQGITSRCQEHIDHLGEVDLGSQGIVIGVLTGLEKHLWMFRSQQV